MTTTVVGSPVVGYPVQVAGPRLVRMEAGLSAPWTALHRLIHREHGGPGTTTSGVCLCRGHHSFLHRPPDRHPTFEHQHLRVYRPDGTELHPDPWHDDAPLAWTA